MNHIMIDIETLGTSMKAPILSIGAVVFDYEDVLPDFAARGEGSTTGFQTFISIESNQKEGRFIESETLKWWLNENPGMLSHLVGHSTREYSLDNGLLALSSWLFEHGPIETVWANSPTFDLMILRDAFEGCGVGIPWGFREERDCRTLWHFTGKPEVANPNKHNALADAWTQAKQVQLAMRCVHYTDA